jgi:ribosomal protein S9
MPGDKWRELGTTAQSGAIRHGLALALRSFVDRETVEKMRLCEF